MFNQLFWRVYFFWMLPLFFLALMIVPDMKIHLDPKMPYTIRGFIADILINLVQWSFLVIFAKRAHDRNISIYPKVIFITLIFIVAGQMEIHRAKICSFLDKAPCDYIYAGLTLVVVITMFISLLVAFFLLVQTGYRGSVPGAERFGPPPAIPDEILEPRKWF